MPVPDYQSFMLPVLRFAGKRPQESIAIRAVIAAMAEEFSLTEADQREMLPSGASTTLGSRVGWACTYMRKAGLIESPQRAQLKITDLGLKTASSTFGVGKGVRKS